MQNWRKPKLSALLWLAAALWCALLFFFSGQTGEESGALSQLITQFLLRALPWLPWGAEDLEFIVRKCAHFGVFAVEGALLGGALMCSLRHPRRAFLLAIAICVSLAGLNEWHQSFIVGRSSELRDVLIDSTGALAGALFTALLLTLLNKDPRRDQS